MSRPDPARWVAGGPDAPAGVPELLREGAAPARAPDSEVLRRSAARVAAFAAVPAPFGLWDSFVARTGLGAKATAAGVAGVAGAAVLAGLVVVGPKTSPVDRPAKAPAAAEQAEALPATAAAPMASPPSLADGLDREARLLEEARAVLTTRPVKALRRLEAHAAAFPGGQLTPEREFLTIDALRRLGRRTEVNQLAARFLASRPGSLYVPRLKAMLAEKQ